ncbi:PDZ domain-containing protein [Paenibacillus filicis]|uniref:PDZ domain-containing protein n=1 Tax=Paenibacillus filicis TaxID=669464 RepID=A0ABU9DGZ7_9BACL
MKSLSSRWYISGYVLAAGLAVLGEIVWVGDPIRQGDMYWIDQLQRLVWLTALVPLLWCAGAVSRLRGSRGYARVLPGLVLLSSAGAAFVLLADASRLFAVILLAGLACLLTLTDLLLAEKRAGAGWLRRSLTVIGLIAAASAGLFWPTPYQVISPGFTLNMNRYAQVEGGEPRGSIEGVLVIERPAFPVDWLYAALLPHVLIEKRDTRITIGEAQQQANLQRTDANKIGSAVAFRKLGIGKGVVPTGVQVVGVPANSPAAGLLKPGDQLAAVQGQPVTSSAGLAAQMQTIQPGTEAVVQLLRGVERLEVKLKTKESEDAPKRAVFGIQVEELVQADLPKQVDYRSYLVYQGGPSHGAVLALTLINQLTPGGVTNGNRVAGTGTIGADGAVGKIGGIEQKAYAVEQAGADVFFVPAGQEADARKGAPALNIVPVRTLDEMLDWLHHHPAHAGST